MKRLYGIIGLAIISQLILTFLTFAPLIMADTKEYRERNLSHTGSARSPHVAASANNVYVAWDDDFTGEDLLLFRKSPDYGMTFGNMANLAEDSRNPRLYDLKADKGNVYVLWNGKDDNETWDIMFRRSTDNGTTFEKTTNLSELVNNTEIISSVSPDMIISDSGTVYVGWESCIDMTHNLDASYAPRCEDVILFTKSLDGGATFDEPTVLFNSSLGAASVRLATGYDNATNSEHVYAIWIGGSPYGNEIFFRKSDDGGDSFGEIRKLSIDANMTASIGKNTTCGCDSHQILAYGNSVYLAWQGSVPLSEPPYVAKEIFFRHSADNGVTFGAILNVSESNVTSTSPKIAISERSDGTNGVAEHVFVFWRDIGRDAVPYGLFAREYQSNNSFTDKTSMIANLTIIPWEIPQVLSKTGTLSIVWEGLTPERDKEIMVTKVLAGTEENSSQIAIETINVSNNIANSMVADAHAEGGFTYLVWLDREDGRATGHFNQWGYDTFFSSLSDSAGK